MAKAIGSGVPVGAFGMTEEVAKYSLEPGGISGSKGARYASCSVTDNAPILRPWKESFIAINSCLLLEIFTNKGIGTAILNDSEQKFYYGD